MAELRHTKQLTVVNSIARAEPLRGYGPFIFSFHYSGLPHKVLQLVPVQNLKNVGCERYVVVTPLSLVEKLIYVSL